MSLDQPSIKNNLNNVVSWEREAKLPSVEESQSISPYSNLYLSISDLEIIHSSSEVPDLVCFSHLRWNFVYQRPQHLLTRCAKQQRVFFIEEPIIGSAESEYLDISKQDGVCVVVPHLPQGLSESAINSIQQRMIDELFAKVQIHNYLLWYYTPMAMTFTRHLEPLVTVYDCMDELSLFAQAPRTLKDCEAELFKRADLVFTGGQSLYEVKRNLHPNVYAFPSSIDKAHFAQARNFTEDPVDQADIPHPRLGFFGVIDERMDLGLLSDIAEARPDWNLVIIGPVVKIDPATLPRHKNIYYLGGKNYQELPGYIAGWDVAMLPFARNNSTRFISPTKTPEYLAAGKPVVSTSIRDVVNPYGQSGLVSIADTVAEFVVAVERAMNNSDESGWLLDVDAFLAQTSWDQTWESMMQLVESVIGVDFSLENRYATIAGKNLRAFEQPSK